MKLQPRRPAFGAAAALAVSLMISPPAWPGGNADEPDSHEDDGPTYFGFVKETGGKVIPDAKVTADIKGRGTVVARTDATGIYKLPGFGKQITPANVVISCSKDGYKQTRTVRRPPPAKKPVTAIETECTMQRVGAK
ncbi:MAG TPA: carboxypeptidase-like regulatory domain-containing protein [Candidatus Binatia bacterium]|jgi:hypothetical protein